MKTGEYRYCIGTSGERRKGIVFYIVPNNIVPYGGVNLLVVELLKGGNKGNIKKTKGK
jgi:hypothetical protein